LSAAQLRFLEMELAELLSAGATLRAAASVMGWGTFKIVWTAVTKGAKMFQPVTSAINECKPCMCINLSKRSGSQTRLFLT
jgi:hypothetical protein